MMIFEFSLCKTFCGKCTRKLSLKQFGGEMLMIFCIITIILALWSLFSVVQFIYYWFFKREQYIKKSTELVPFPNGAFHKERSGNILVQYTEENQNIVKIFKKEDIVLQKGKIATLEEITMRPVMSKTIRLNLFYHELEYILNQEVDRRIIITMP